MTSVNFTTPSWLRRRLCVGVMLSGPYGVFARQWWFYPVSRGTPATVNVVSVFRCRDAGVRHAGWFARRARRRRRRGPAVITAASAGCAESSMFRRRLSTHRSRRELRSANFDTIVRPSALEETFAPLVQPGETAAINLPIYRTTSICSSPGHEYR